MLPTIRPGDCLIVKSRDPQEIQPGQIILYTRERGLVAHRVVSRSGDDWMTRGDCMRSADAPVHSKDIVGGVVGIVREGRQITPEWTRFGRAAAWFLRRSDVSVRVILHWHRRSRRKGPLRPAADFATL